MPSNLFGKKITISFEFIEIKTNEISLKNDFSFNKELKSLLLK